MKKEKNKGTEEVCRKMAEADFTLDFSRENFLDMCRESGVSYRDMDLYLYETFGMSWFDIMCVLYG